MFIPKGLQYTRNHLWLRKIGVYDYFIGLTDFAQKEIGRVNLIELKLEDDCMKKKYYGVLFTDIMRLLLSFLLLNVKLCQLILPWIKAPQVLIIIPI